MIIGKVSKIALQAIFWSLVILVAAQNYRVLEALVLWACFLLLLCLIMTTVLLTQVLYAAGLRSSHRLVAHAAEVRAHAHVAHVQAQRSSIGGAR